MLQARDIQKHYGQLWVLKGVSLSLEKGEIVSIVGPSGSGKKHITAYSRNTRQTR